MDLAEFSNTRNTRVNVSKSFLDKSVSIKGDLNFADTLEIQGSIVGNILSQSNSISFLIIGKNSEIIGDITASHVVVSGKVVGNIHTQHIEIEETARIYGSVNYKSIEIHPGAKIDGSMTAYDNQSDILNSSEQIETVKTHTIVAQNQSSNSVSVTKIPVQQIEVPA